MVKITSFHLSHYTALYCTVLYVQVRALPIAVLRPVAGAAEAISYALLGMEEMPLTHLSFLSVHFSILLHSSLLLPAPPLSGELGQSKDPDLI